jgi:opine dehydrogenase
MLTVLRAPGQINTRWLTEDVPYGLVPWSDLGGQLGVATPVIDATIALASAALGTDFRQEARALASIGLRSLDSVDLANFLDHGVA